MTSYTFISQLFTAILSKSKSIEGRFYVCPKLGNEINSDDLGQVIQENTERLDKKYPLVLMMPPTMRGNYAGNDFGSYNITLFFLRTSYYGEDANINPLTNTSMRTIMQDWAEMQAVWSDFGKALTKLQAKGYYQQFRIGTREAIIQPISSIGIDRASGVRVDFELQLPYGCEPLSDYEDINLIEIPT